MSRFVKLIPVHTLQSVEFAKELTAFVNTFGTPVEFYSDNHGQFSSAFMKQTLELLGTRLAHSSAYSSEEQGQVERINGLVREHLDRIMMEYPNHSWDLFVSFVERIINTSVNTSTNYEPARVIFGPGAEILPGVDKPTASTIAEWIELVNLFQTHAVAIHSEVLQEKAAVIEAANQQSPPTVFQVGDLVWLANEARSTKTLGIPWRKDPFTVLVTIADLVVSGGTRTVHISNVITVCSVFNLFRCRRTLE